MARVQSTVRTRLTGLDVRRLAIPTAEQTTLMLVAFVLGSRMIIVCRVALQAVARVTARLERLLPRRISDEVWLLRGGPSAAYVSHPTASKLQFSSAA